MSPKQWLAAAAWVFVPVAATAQQKHSQYHPADATAPASIIRYESAFASYRGMSDDSDTPDKVWRSTNDEMGKIGGHGGHMKGSEEKLPVSPNANNATPKQGGIDHSKHH